MSETSQKTMQSLWTSSAEASPVKTSPWPDTGPDWTVRDPAFSMRCRESFAILDRKSGSWKTSQTSLFSDYQTFSERWPDAGIMLGGAVFVHPTWEHHTAEIDGSVSPGTWPTPLKFMANMKITEKIAMHRFRNLEVILARGIWPTPQKFDGQMNKNLEWYEERVKINPQAQKNIQVECQRYSTPDLREQNGQHINPEWVEMLMGFPPGWTLLDIDGQPHQGHSPQESLPDSVTDTPQISKD